MKPFFLTIFAILFIFVGVARAQTTVNCSVVNDQNHSICCSVGAGTANAQACSIYANAQAHGYANAEPAATSPETTTTANQNTAPVGGQCDNIFNFNFNECCVTYYSVNKTKCDAVSHGYYTPTLPGAVGNGIATGAVNNDPALTQHASNAPSGSLELQQCSKIKFVSVFDILVWVKCIILVAIIPLIFAAALVFFLWGVMKFIAAADPVKKQEGKKFIIAGLIGLFVMTSLWGIIKIVGNTLGTGSAVPILQTSSLK